jgi:hypothetical protein
MYLAGYGGALVRMPASLMQNARAYADPRAYLDLFQTGYSVNTPVRGATPISNLLDSLTKTHDHHLAT